MENAKERREYLLASTKATEERWSTNVEPGEDLKPQFRSRVKNAICAGILLGCCILAAVGQCGYSRHGRVHSDSKFAPAAVRDEPTPQIDPPYDSVVWGDVNFIHTTDTHGWLLGHQKNSEPEPNASGTLGDFYSFVSHMKAQAKERSVDLLVVDSGDLHDGNGLSDGFPEGGVDGHETNQIITEVPYDVLSIGNHEMYRYPVAYDVYKNFAPKWKGRFLTSNVNITVVGSNGSLTTVPVGERYTRFTTLQGRKVLALGVLLDFKNNAQNTTVQTTKDLVRESWFKEVIREEVDFFLLVGHMAVSDNNWRLLFNAIRAMHPHTPIFIFGGHYHIRDCNMLDDRAMALASGRYMETVGWMSATIPANDSANMNLTRRYLDANRVTYVLFRVIRGASTANIRA
ncbi:hypothetical protein FRB94_006993 [Tulasnella sp. JGI-2019a]|nr:hypothetical protein FRB94_006993 [Tulasnella sp. JGI-2019a]KAG9028253.1 hypothetical protein FRB95_006659 [Tulasnella sp. JGI-2019a]